MSVRRGFMLVTAGQGVSMASAYATHIILARKLGPADYGRYGVFLSVASTVALFLTAGVPEAVTKFSAEEPSSAPAIFARGLRLQLAFSLIVTVVYALLSPLFARVLNDPSLTPEFILSAASIPPVAVYALITGAYSGHKRFGAQALVVGGYGALRSLLTIAFASYQAVRGAVLGIVLAPYIVALAALPGIYRSVAPGGVATKQLLAFARPVILFTVAFGLLMNLDLLVVKALSTNDVEVGFYTAASTIAKVPFFAFSSLGVVLLPTVSAAARTNPGELDGARAAMRWTFLASLSMAFAGAPLTTAALRLLYGERYADSGLALAILILSGTLLTQVYILSYALNGVGQPRLGMLVTIAGLVLEPALVVLGYRQWALAGAAVGSCATSLVLLVATLHLARGHLGKVIGTRTLCLTLLAGAATWALGAALPTRSALSIGLFVPLTGVNVCLLMAVREVSPAELLAPFRKGRSGASA
jgi:O-antigen/teichoic acid export membrane protein